MNKRKQVFVLQPFLKIKILEVLKPCSGLSDNTLSNTTEKDITILILKVHRKKEKWITGDKILERARTHNFPVTGINDLEKIMVRGLSENLNGYRLVTGIELYKEKEGYQHYLLCLSHWSGKWIIDYRKYEDDLKNFGPECRVLCYS